MSYQVLERDEKGYPTHTIEEITWSLENAVEVTPEIEKALKKWTKSNSEMKANAIRILPTLNIPV